MLKKERESGLTDPKRLARFAGDVERWKAQFEALIGRLLKDGARLIGYGAAAKATIAEGSRRKMLGRKTNVTMLFDTVETTDGKQIRLRETPVHRAGAERKPRLVGKMVGKDGSAKVAAATSKTNLPRRAAPATTAVGPSSRSVRIVRSAQGRSGASGATEPLPASGIDRPSGATPPSGGGPSHGANTRTW